jgi:hypothetical protein
MLHDQSHDQSLDRSSISLLRSAEVDQVGTKCRAKRKLKQGHFVASFRYHRRTMFHGQGVEAKSFKKGVICISQQVYL